MFQTKFVEKIKTKKRIILTGTSSPTELTYPVRKNNFTIRRYTVI